MYIILVLLLALSGPAEAKEKKRKAKKPAPAPVVQLSPEAAACEAKKKKQYSLFLDMNDSPNERGAAERKSAEECLGFVRITSVKHLEQTLARIYKDKEASVPVITTSGHSVNSQFDGTQFKFGFNDLSRLTQKYPRFGQDIQSVFLWGCFTANPKKLRRWHDAFPNATSIIGYTGRSPLDEQEVGAQFLESFWDKRHLIHDGKTDAEVKATLDGFVPRLNDGTFMVTAGISLYTCDAANPNHYYYMVDNVHTERDSILVSDEDLDKSCEIPRKELAAKMADLERYWTGTQEPYGASDPEYKDRQINTLRYDLYPWFNANEHCFENGIRMNDGAAVGLNEMVNMIFYGHIKGNFVTKFTREAKAAKAAMRGIPGINGLDNIRGMSRAQVIALDDLMRNPATRDAVKKKKGANGLAKFDAFAWKFHHTVRNLNGACADITWIEEGGHVTTPPAACSKPALH